MKELNQQLRKSTLFLQTDKSKVTLNIPLTVIVYFVLWLIGLGLGRLLALFLLNVFEFTGNVNGNITVALRKLMICGTQITVFFAWVKFAEKRPVNSLGFQGGRPLKSYITGAIVGGFTITAIAAILLFAEMTTLQHRQEEYGYLIANIGIIALSWIIQSASEEIAIRGWLIPRLGNQSTPLRAIGITAVIFGILHLFSAGVTVLSFINLILSGIFFAGYAILNGNIWGTCGLHFAWNFALGNIYGFPVSGFSANGETIFQAQQTGANLFTGGSFGPEGGLVTTIILLIAIAVLIVNWNKNVRISLLEL